MPDTVTPARVEPTLGPGSAPSANPVEELRAAVEAAPVVGAASPAVAGDSARIDRAALDQLSRIEEKTARIEEKYARTEFLMQRVQDKVEAAAGRMGEVALQSDLVAARERLNELGTRVRRLPGVGALFLTALVTAVLAAAFTLAAQKYLPGLLP
jgi:hypothetical protein